MNSSNALGFVGLGTFMQLLPQLAPSMVATETTIGASSRALWLLVVGTVMLVIGGSVLLRTGWTALARQRTYAPLALPKPVVAQPVWQRRPASASLRGATAMRRVQA